MSDEGDDSWLPLELLEREQGLDEELLAIQRQLLRAKLFGVGSGVRLGSYELIEEIGRGAMGVVYAARDPKLDRKVAIKRVQDGDEPQLRRRLVLEARAMAKLDHPNVVPIYEIHETPTLAFIVMPLVEGTTLRRWQDEGRRAQAEIIAAYLAAGQGLAAAHQKGLVHRDFKPDNVMIDSEGNVRVMDFGLAQLAVSRESSFVFESQTALPRGAWDGARPLTQTGALVGTPAYMAPEQLRGRRADAASDQFGFCVALYEALYGERPFAEDSFEEMRAAAAQGRLRAAQPSAGVSAAVRAVLVRGLEPEPNRRFAVMEELLSALEEAGVPGADARFASDTQAEPRAGTSGLLPATQDERAPVSTQDGGAMGGGATNGGVGMDSGARQRTDLMASIAGAASRSGGHNTGSHRSLPHSFNGYELLDKLGEGGMGEVWSARRRGLGDSIKHVAIKLIAPRHYEDPYLRELFLTEARLSMLLNNSRIVQVFDVGEVDDTCYMAMEWVDGLNLAEFSRALRKRGGSLSCGQATFILAELLRALTYAHEPTTERDHPLIHRDISPQNVMLSLTGEVKLMDFGIATLMSDDTSGGGVKGKPRYMPPEQFVDRVRRPTIDLFALGAIFHELIDNRVFRSGVVDGGELYGMIVSGRYPTLREPLPPELEALRAGLLEPDPSKRIPSAREALRQLRAWSGFRDSSEEIEALVRELSGRGSLEGLAPESGRSTGPRPVLHAASSGSSGGARSSEPDMSSGALERAATLLSAPHPIVSAELADDETPLPLPESEPRRAWVYLLLFALPLLALGLYYGVYASAEREREEDMLARSSAAQSDPSQASQSAFEARAQGSGSDEGDASGTRGPALGGEATQGERDGRETGAETEGAETEGAETEGIETEAGAPEDSPETPRPSIKTPKQAPEPGHTPKQEVSASGGAVTLSIEQHGQFCIDVRLGGKPARNIERKPYALELEPGKHSCAVRVCGAEGWESVGSVSLAAGSSPTLYIDWPRQESKPKTVELR